MTAKAEYEKKWKDKEPIERRHRLNQLAAQGYDMLSEDGQREHDALAGMVAADEDEAAAQIENNKEGDE